MGNELWELVQSLWGVPATAYAMIMTRLFFKERARTDAERAKYEELMERWNQTVMELWMREKEEV